MKLNNTQNINYYMEIIMRLMHVMNGSRLVKPLDWLALYIAWEGILFD